MIVGKRGGEATNYGKRKGTRGERMDIIHVHARMHVCKAQTHTPQKGTSYPLKLP